MSEPTVAVPSAEDPEIVQSPPEETPTIQPKTSETSVAVPSAEEPEIVQPPPEETPIIPEDEQFQYGHNGELLSAAFDEDFFSPILYLATLMHPEWQLLVGPESEDDMRLAYRLSKDSIYYKCFVSDMFRDKKSRSLLLEDVAQFKVTGIDVVENAFAYCLYHLKWQELRRRNGRVQEMMAYCVAPGSEEAVMGDLTPAGSDRIKLSATIYPLIDQSKSEGTLVYCKVVISKTGRIKPGKQNPAVDTLVSEDGLMEKFAQDEVFPICLIHYKL